MAGLERREGHFPDRALTSRNGQIAQLIEAAYGSTPQRRGESAPLAWGHPAVARLSGHLAAMQRTVYPAARRRLGEDLHLLRECRAHARETGWALRLLHCHLAGDGAAGGRKPENVHGWLEHCLDRYRPAERALVARMEERLTAGEREQLAHGYHAALVRAPTRPHPRGPHTGWPGRVAFRLHGFWDGVLDAMDSRPGGARPD
jgi:hypothetical protein